MSEFATTKKSVRSPWKRPIVRYAKPGADKDGLYVDLIGAIHIGDKAYYQQLNKDFSAYDALLYELVAPQGTRVPKHRDADGAPQHSQGTGLSGDGGPAWAHPQLADALHVGRVNTARRIRLCAEAGVNSFDGTSATMYACTLSVGDVTPNSTGFVIGLDAAPNLSVLNLYSDVPALPERDWALRT